MLNCKMFTTWQYTNIQIKKMLLKITWENKNKYNVHEIHLNKAYVFIKLWYMDIKTTAVSTKALLHSTV